MASQIAHVVYGKKIFERLNGLLWTEFLMGTLFPDIRYPAKIDRDITHVFGTSEEAIPKEDSFNAGLYVHCFVDEKRESFVRSKDIYNLFPQKLYAASYKLVEDLVVYNKIDNWKEITSQLTTYHPTTREYGIDEKTIWDWYNLLKRYFSKKPDEKEWYKMITTIGFDKKLAQKVIEHTRLIRNNEKAMDIIQETYKAI